METDLENIVYGPVPSWRFGRSLGIDPTLPPKKCSFGCIYCQLGITQNYYNQVIDDPSFLKPDQLEKALEKKLNLIDTSTIDIVIFSGSGEPTLNPHLQELIKTTRKLIPDKPVGILSNGSFITVPSVQKALKELDVVSLKLDTAIQKTFIAINRPAKGLPSIEQLIEKYSKFKKQYHGILGLEIMLLKTVDGKVNNLTPSEKQALIKAIKTINPDIIELEVPYRPPSESKVMIPSYHEVHDFSTELKKIFGENKVWVYGERNAAQKQVKWKTQTPEEIILSTLKHRPCRIQDLEIILGEKKEEIAKTLKELLRKNKITTYKQGEHLFYVTIEGKRR